MKREEFEEAMATGESLQEAISRRALLAVEQTIQELLDGKIDAYAAKLFGTMFIEAMWPWLTPDVRDALNLALKSWSEEVERRRLEAKGRDDAEMGEGEFA
jgi:hypothetical protein